MPRLGPGMSRIAGRCGAVRHEWGTRAERYPGVTGNGAAGPRMLSGRCAVQFGRPYLAPEVAVNLLDGGGGLRRSVPPWVAAPLIAAHPAPVYGHTRGPDARARRPDRRLQPAEGRCFRMVQSVQLQATHCRQKPWKSVLAGPYGAQLVRRGVPAACAKAGEGCRRVSQRPARASSPCPVRIHFESRPPICSSSGRDEASRHGRTRRRRVSMGSGVASLTSRLRRVKSRSRRQRVVPGCLPGPPIGRRGAAGDRRHWGRRAPPRPERPAVGRQVAQPTRRLDGPGAHLERLGPLEQLVHLAAGGSHSDARELVFLPRRWPPPCAMPCGGRCRSHAHDDLLGR